LGKLGALSKKTFAGGSAFIPANRVALPVKYVKSSARKRALLAGRIHSPGAANFFSVTAVVSARSGFPARRIEKRVCAMSLISRLGRLTGREPVSVMGMFLNVTTRCNLNCPGCYGHLQGLAGQDMSLATAVRAADLYLAHRKEPERYGIIIFFGGEPLLNYGMLRDFVSWMEQNRPPAELGYHFAIVTNGLLLDRDKASFLFGHGVEVYVSIDGPYETHVKRRPCTRERFETLTENLACASGLDPGKLLFALSIVRRADIPGYGGVVDFLAGLGVSQFCFQRDFHEPDWSGEDQRLLLNVVKGFKGRHPGFRFRSYPESGCACKSCDPGQLAVYPDGSVYDFCHTFACSLLREGRITGKQLEIFRYGSLESLGALTMDARSRRKIVTRRMFCPTLARDYEALKGEGLD